MPTERKTFSDLRVHSCAYPHPPDRGPTSYGWAWRRLRLSHANRSYWIQSLRVPLMGSTVVSCGLASRFHFCTYITLTLKSEHTFIVVFRLGFSSTRHSAESYRPSHTQPTVCRIIAPPFGLHGFAHIFWCRFLQGLVPSKTRETRWPSAKSHHHSELEACTDRGRRPCKSVGAPVRTSSRIKESSHHDTARGS